MCSLCAGPWDGPCRCNSPSQQFELSPQALERHLPLVPQPCSCGDLRPCLQHRPVLQETHRPYSSTLRASNVGHMASQEEGHQPPSPQQCPLCIILNPKVSSAEPSFLDTVNTESSFPRTRLPLSKMTSPPPPFWDFCFWWLLGLSQALSAVALMRA